MKEKKITKVCSIENVLDSWFDHELGMLVSHWYNLGSGEQIRIGFEENHLTMKKLEGKYLVIDLSKTRGVPHPSEERFFESRVFPHIQTMKFEQQVIVLPTNPLTKFGFKDFIAMGKELNCNFTLKNSLEEAVEFIRAYHTLHYPAPDRKNSLPL
jgi:hypothetical protein